jgi:hypothetical protein
MIHALAGCHREPLPAQPCHAGPAGARSALAGRYPGNRGARPFVAGAACSAADDHGRQRINRRCATVAPAGPVAAGLPGCRTRWDDQDAMPTDLTVILEHRPGELTRLGEVAGEAGARIRGLAAFTGDGRGVVHLLLDDPVPGGARAGRNRHRRRARGPGGRDRGPVRLHDIATTLGITERHLWQCQRPHRSPLRRQGQGRPSQSPRVGRSGSLCEESASVPAEPRPTRKQATCFRKRTVLAYGACQSGVS